MSERENNSEQGKQGMIPEKDVLTSDEVASILEVELITVQRMAKRGDLPARKVGREWRFLTEEIVRWLRGEDVHPQ